MAGVSQKANFQEGKYYGRFSEIIMKNNQSIKRNLQTILTKYLYIVFFVACPLIFVSILGAIYIKIGNGFWTGQPELKSFHEFAYTSDSNSPPRPIPTITPSFPWQPISQIPGQQNIPNSYSQIQVVLARTYNNQPEIWLNKFHTFLVYYPQLHIWKEIPNQINNTNIKIEKVYLDPTGVIWGTTHLNSVPDSYQTIPILNQFNESTQQFESVEDGFLISRKNFSNNNFREFELLIDKKGVIWIFVPNDAVYRYDPKQSTLEKQVELPQTSGLEIALAPSGNIYFQDLLPPENNQAFLFLFNPQEKSITPFYVPSKPWTYSSGMLVDRHERLWLGSVGYINPDGSWKIFDPDPQHETQNFWKPGSLVTAPRIILESSDGILWYLRYNDTNLKNEGIAWFNPETGEGQQITNMPSQIVEDDQKQLWMVIRGKLYRYTIFTTESTKDIKKKISTKKAEAN